MSLLLLFGGATASAHAAAVSTTVVRQVVRRSTTPAAIILPLPHRHAVPAEGPRVVSAPRASRNVSAIILSIPRRTSSTIAKPAAAVTVGRVPSRSSQRLPAIFLPLPPKHAVPVSGPTVVGNPRRSVLPRPIILNKPGPLFVPPPTAKRSFPITVVAVPRRYHLPVPLLLSHAPAAHRTPAPSLARGPLVVTLPLSPRPIARVITIRPLPRARKAAPSVVVVPQPTRSKAITGRVLAGILRPAQTQPKRARGPLVVSLPVTSHPVPKSITTGPALRKRIRIPSILVVQRPTRRERTSPILWVVSNFFPAAGSALFTEVSISRAGMVIENFLVSLASVPGSLENSEVTASGAVENIIIEVEG